jgi:hypothetical protein
VGYSFLRTFSDIIPRCKLRNPLGIQAVCRPIAEVSHFHFGKLAGCPTASNRSHKRLGKEFAVLLEKIGVGRERDVSNFSECAAALEPSVTSRCSFQASNTSFDPSTVVPRGFVTQDEMQALQTVELWAELIIY